MHHRSRILLFFVLTAVVVVGCSTKRNTWMSRHYQALISAYNVYHNGNEAFKSGVEKIRERTKNDYSYVLPVYEFANASVAKAGSSDMETALKKAHKLIQLHSITVKPERKAQMTEADKRFYAQEEFNPYIDKAYLLIGKANVVKHSEDEALKVFDYLSRKYSKNPSAFEGKIWASIAYCQLGQYINARTALESYDLEGFAPEELYGQFMAAYANVYICQSLYAEAIPYMEKAVENASDRATRRRYKYILAQLYRQVGQNDKAVPLFSELSRGLQDYDMAFAAKLDLATVAESDYDLAKAEKNLDKMVRDAKNEEQLDQIYYAKGKIEMQRGDEDRAVENYQRSVEASVSNDNQKGLSFLAMADIYVARPEYVDAGTSFDSASIYLDDSNLRKDEATQQADLLRPLVEELLIIEEQDSLLRIANMSERDREAFIQKMVDEARQKEEEAEELRLAEEEATMSQSQYSQLTSNSIPGFSGSQQSWYFYNTTMIQAGKSTFARKWGRRKNEDDWRRSNRTKLMDDSAASDGEGQTDSATVASNSNRPEPGDGRVTRESLLAGLPLTAEDKAASEQMVAKALFNSACILYDDIHDYPSAIEQINTLLRRFPQTDDRYNALVLLYFAQQKNGDPTGMASTASTVRREYPSTDFARYLSEQDYFDARSAEHQSLEDRYLNAYNAYLMGRYAEATQASTAALVDTADTEHAPKYMLVRSLAYAKQGLATQFRSDLLRITERYPGGEEDSVAQVMLALLDKGMSPIRAIEYQSPLSSRYHDYDSELPEAETFVFRPDTLHSVVCVVDSGMSNRALFVIADYNFSNYLLDDFDILAGELSNGQPTITIRGFEDKDAAMTYFYAIRDQEFWKEVSSSTVPLIMPVSDNNLKLMRLMSIGDEYQLFFEKNYLRH